MRYKQQIAWALIGVIVMALILLAAVTMVRTTQVVDLIRADQKPNIARAQQTQELAETIKSCTTPGGECYDRGQEQTGEAVGSITDFNVYLAVCEKRPDVFSVGQFKTCVQELLLKEARHR